MILFAFHNGKYPHLCNCQIFNGSSNETEFFLENSVSLGGYALFIDINSLFSHSSGDYSEEETPVTIPNTAVKLFSADDTLRATSRESRSLPGDIIEASSQFVDLMPFFVPATP